MSESPLNPSDARRVTVAEHLIFVAAGTGGLQILLGAIPARLQVVGLFGPEFHISADAAPGSLLQFQYSSDLPHWSNPSSPIFMDAASKEFYKDDFDDEAQLFFRAFWR